jgi:hypothetical protein
VTAIGDYEGVVLSLDFFRQCVTEVIDRPGMLVSQLSLIHLKNITGKTYALKSPGSTEPRSAPRNVRGARRRRRP